MLLIALLMIKPRVLHKPGKYSTTELFPTSCPYHIYASFEITRLFSPCIELFLYAWNGTNLITVYDSSGVLSNLTLIFCWGSVQIYSSEIPLYTLLILIVSLQLWQMIMLALSNKFRSIFCLLILWDILKIIGITSCIKVWRNSVVNPSNPELFF